MALTSRARGDLGTWVVEQRKPPHQVKTWTQDDLAKRLRARDSGVLWNRTKVADIERGKHEPNADERADLASVLGEIPDFDTAAPADIGGLVIALNRQAAAIELLVSRFDSLASQAIRDGVADALREAAALQAAAVSQSGLHPGQQP